MKKIWNPILRKKIEMSFVEHCVRQHMQILFRWRFTSTSTLSVM